MTEIKPSDSKDLSDPPWLAYAKTQLGVTEISGSSTNPKIHTWLKSMDASWDNDETPWCALFISTCLKATGYSYPSKWSWALAYASFGVRLSKPAVGCIAVKRRLDSNGKVIGGHVTFIVGQDENKNLIGLGGNQSDSVCYRVFPRSDFIAYVWPSIYPKEERFNLPTFKNIQPSKLES